MLKRLIALFNRYAAQHMTAPIADWPDLPKETSLSELRVERGQLVVAGSTNAQTVSLAIGTNQRWAEINEQGGKFSFALPYRPDELSLTVDGKLVELPHPSARSISRRRLRMMPGFGYRVAKCTPAVLRWMRHRDTSARVEVRHLLGLDGFSTNLSLLPIDIAPVRGATSSTQKVTIVLPVYNGADLLIEVLDRVGRYTDTPWRMIVIDDASTDSRIAEMLSAYVAGRDNVELITHAQNQGFIRSVNEAMERALVYEDPVILLNSDALVPSNWASRMIAPLSDASVASVTPLSNDAELCSVPVICNRLDLPQGAADRIDAVAAQLSAERLAADAPTGVGFCMAISPAWLQKLPKFDTVFGRGYGEEVDWCQSIVALGGRHVLQPRLFVEHRGGASFGSEEKRRLIAQNSAIVSERHPNFDADVQTFIAADPLITPRLVLALAWASSTSTAPVPVILSHTLGGGAEMYLQRRIEDDLARCGSVVVLRIGGQERWQIELHTPVGITSGGTSDDELLCKLIGLLEACHIVYSCAVSDRDPVHIPSVLLRLSNGQKLEVLTHDYFYVSPSYTLLSQSETWKGVPDVATSDVAHSVRRPDGTLVSLPEWQSAWRPLLHAADDVVVFSESSRDIVSTVYPEISERLRVRPHAPLIDMPRCPATPASDTPVIGVMGNIAPAKGARPMVALSQRLVQTKEARLVHLGQMDPAFSLHPKTTCHGAYDLCDIPDLIRRYSISMWFMPSVWPETFSYVTHECVATGLPVACYDLGAQADVVRSLGSQGCILPLCKDYSFDKLIEFAKSIE